MLKRIRFKNYRSLRDVELDNLTPLTVLIGANASGKSNIVEGLYFLRRMLKADAPDSAYFVANQEQVPGLDAENDPVELEIQFRASGEGDVTYELGILPSDGKVRFRERLADTHYGYTITADENGKVRYDDEESAPRAHSDRLVGSRDISRGYGFRSYDVDSYDVGSLTSPVVTWLNRCQLLNENFTPPRVYPLGEVGEVYVIERDARNTVLILDFMQQQHPEIYKELQDDLRWLLDHVEVIDLQRSERGTRLLVNEKYHPNRDAPTISAGTGRLLAMLTAYYALDMRSPELPGLVVIEEPDTSIHPLLLQDFVEQLRNYVEGEHPRQFIMTTHNPHLLNYFQPEEVRIVERDEQGFTHVKTVPDDVARIWLEKHTLGTAWLTRSLGGVPS